MLKTLNGDYQPTSGTYLLDGEEKHFKSPHQAIEEGVSIIYQERQILLELSVAENIYLGRMPSNRLGVINTAQANRMAQKIIDDFGLPIRPTEKVKNLSIAYQQMVEIMKAYSRENLRVICLDEPTASLSDAEIESLFAIIRKLKELTGRPIGINLEPVEQVLSSENPEENMWAMTGGRKATLENAKKAADMGVNFILLTGNPGIGVTNEAIEQTLRLYKQAFGDRLILAAGKMHASGILTEGAENIITKDDIAAFSAAGADIILLPAPGTVPGITVEYIRHLVSYAHSLGCLTITAIGTSQEGADIATIRQIALMCKMTGTDIHHLGDAGYGGMALPENIQAYSIAIRGIRHTYRRMAGSVNR